MIQSMTGYGKAEALLPSGKLTIEIRTLNGKNADIGIKTSILPKDKELEIRAKIAARLHRGTIDLYTNWEPAPGESARQVDRGLVQDYFRQIQDIYTDCVPNGGQLDPSLLMSTILRFPDVVEAKRQDVVTEENWPLVEAAVDAALDAVDAFRSREGAVLYADVTSRVRQILSLEDEVEALEEQRIATVRERLRKNLEDLAVQVDPARFEQEMIFYLEKLDINEEKVRLRQHCRYFLDTIDTEPCPGKKLGFIIQEMGREINTTGSKANHAQIQKIVVRMKDELEKIREQSMNIL